MALIPIYDSKGDCVAKADRHESNRLSPVERDANMTFLAAAPDMLAALKAIIARINGEWDNPELQAIGPLMANESIDIEFLARQAIAKAKGELPDG